MSFLLAVYEAVPINSGLHQKVHQIAGSWKDMTARYKVNVWMLLWVGLTVLAITAIGMQRALIVRTLAAWT